MCRAIHDRLWLEEVVSDYAQESFAGAVETRYLRLKQERFVWWWLVSFAVGLFGLLETQGIP
jgi:hypothetical protein